MQTEVGRSSGAQACVTRGFKSASVRRLAKSPRNAFLKSKNDEDG